MNEWLKAEGHQGTGTWSRILNYNSDFTDFGLQTNKLN